MSGKHLLVAISSHGFGHLSQVAPAVNALKGLLPDLTITVRGAFDAARIRSRIPLTDSIEAIADDIGMIMIDAVTTDVDASATALHDFHSDWARKVDALAEHLVKHQVDLVLADVPYLTLAAAERAGIPTVALSSLNWADIFEDSLGHRIDQVLLNQIRDCYQSARYFLQCAPAMPMAWLNNRKVIGPVCSPGKPQRERLLHEQQLPPDTWLVLVSMGGVQLDLTLQDWPTYIRNRPVYYVTQADICKTHPHAISIDLIDCHYSDLIASADLVVTKPGYGTFAEVACSGIPVIYLERNDWPETAALTAWLHTVANCRSVTYQQLNSASIEPVMDDLLSQGRYLPVKPSGNDEAATVLANLLGYL